MTAARKDIGDYARIGRLGGIARNQKHGNPGTPEGRRLGGRRSIATHQKNKTGFLVARKIRTPSPSARLAEICGIIAGDGHIGEYQTSVCTNSVTDMEHALYTKGLFEKLFGVPASLTKRRGQNACVVVVSSKEVGNFLTTKGMAKGDKIQAGLRIPGWVRAERKYRLAFTKGLFDTDGCVYTDRHTIRGREYKNLCMAFTNRSVPLLSDFFETLEYLDLHPTQKTKYTVFLRRRENIRRYFKIVGSSNPKHLRKIQGYFSS